MRNFTLSEFVSFLGTLPGAVEHANHEALEKAAVIVETEAKRVIGTYDYGWPQLAPSTQQQRQHLGYPANEPLLRTSELRESIQHVATHREACIGSNNDKAVWQEMGTSRIPPRPFLQGAVNHKISDILEEIGRRVMVAMRGRS